MGYDGRLQRESQDKCESHPTHRFGRGKSNPLQHGLWLYAGKLDSPGLHESLNPKLIALN